MWRAGGGLLQGIWYGLTLGTGREESGKTKGKVRKEIRNHEQGIRNDE